MESSSSAGTSVRETADNEREGAGAEGRAVLDSDVEDAGEACAVAGVGGAGEGRGEWTWSLSGALNAHAVRAAVVAVRAHPAARLLEALRSSASAPSVRLPEQPACSSGARARAEAQQEAVGR